MSASATPNPNAASPTTTPDIWVASATAALQTYVNLGKVAGPPNVAEITSIIGKLQSQNAIPQPVATSILDFLKTPGAATVVSNSAILADRAYAYINAHAGAAAPPRTTTSVAATSVAATSGAAAMPAKESSPTLNMTAQQVIAVAEFTNYVLQKLGEPSLSTDPSRGVVRTADVSSEPPPEPGLESDGVGNVLAGLAAGIAATVVVGGAAAVDLTEEVVSAVAGDLIVDGIGDAVDAFITSEPPEQPPPSDGMGSGGGAWPGTSDEGGVSTPDDDGGDGSGEGVDDKPGLQPK